MTGTETGPADAKEAAISRARALGFGLVRVAPVELDAGYEAALGRWLAAGEHGEMAWMARGPRGAAAVRAWVPNARSVICLAANYGPPADGRARSPSAPATSDGAGGADASARRPYHGLDVGRISQYAVTRDYHRVLGRRLREFCGWLRATYGAQARACVDTSPLLERAYAETAGLGYIGRNSMLITREFGSYVFLAEVITDLPLAPDTARPTLRCGRCRRCVPACPTGAIHGDRTLDARRCISYLTIEHRGPIPLELRPLMGAWVFGCDVCQLVCPHNSHAHPAHLDEFLRVRFPGGTLPLAELLAIRTDAEFAARFAGTPLMRAKRRGLVRNACVAAGNSGRAELLAPLRALLAAETDQLIVEHAAWAVARLAQ